MAVARVGTGVTGTGDAAANSIAASAKNTTTGNAIFVGVKWENATTPTLLSVTDTAGNTYTVDQQGIYTPGNEPHGAIAYCLNATGNAANVITANFSAATATFRRIHVEEFSGVATSAGVDGTHTVLSGTGVNFSSGAITTTGPGVVFMHVSGFTGFTPTAGGTPAATLGATTSDAFCQFYISATGQSVTPGASANNAGDWIMLATAFKAGTGAIVQGSRFKSASVHPGSRGPQPLGRFRKTRRPNISNPPAPDVTLGLTGIGGTGAVGTVGLTHTQALTGNAATGAVGTVAPTSPNALTGNAGTGAAGTVAPTLSLGVTGNAATAAVGTVVPSLSIGLTGNQATGAVGTLGGVASNAVGSRRRSMAMNPGVNPYNIAKFFKSRKNTETLPTAPIVLGLTGNQAAGSVGTVGVTHTQAQTGNAATAAVGTLAPSTTVGVTGNTGTGGVGSVALPGTASISGNQATGSAGTVSPATVVAITGNAGTGAVGTLVSTKAKALSGNAATGSVGTVGDSRTVALTGNAATGSPGTVVVFNGNITIALTGNQATGQAGTVTVGSGAVVDETQRVRVRTLSWAEVVRKAWGKDWNKPDIVYEFSNRKFEERKRGGPYDPEDFED